MENENPKLKEKRKNFYENYGHYSEIEIQKEHLFKQEIIIEKLEKIRANTSNLVWFLVVIPAILGFVYLVSLFSN